MENQGEYFYWVFAKEKWENEGENEWWVLIRWTILLSWFGESIERYILKWMEENEGLESFWMLIIIFFIFFGFFMKIDDEDGMLMKEKGEEWGKY